MMKRLVSFVTALSLVLVLSGCTSLLEGKGRVGVVLEDRTGIFFESEATATDADAKSKSTLDLDPLMDLILKYQEAQEAQKAASPESPAPSNE